MARSSSKRPPIANFGGYRLAKRRVNNSAYLHDKREQIAREIFDLVTANITNIVNFKDGSVKPIEEIPEKDLKAIKKISVAKDGTMTIEMENKAPYIKIMAQVTGMLDKAENENKPSIVGINLQAPEVIEVDEK